MCKTPKYIILYVSELQQKRELLFTLEQWIRLTTDLPSLCVRHIRGIGDIDEYALDLSDPRDLSNFRNEFMNNEFQ
jgi:hypothetical protein